MFRDDSHVPPETVPDPLRCRHLHRHREGVREADRTAKVTSSPWRRPRNGVAFTAAQEGPREAAAPVPLPPPHQQRGPGCSHLRPAHSLWLLLGKSEPSGGGAGRGQAGERKERRGSGEGEAGSGEGRAEGSVPSPPGPCEEGFRPSLRTLPCVGPQSTCSGAVLGEGVPPGSWEAQAVETGAGPKPETARQEGRVIGPQPQSRP